ncbi:MAG TPA: hypothetical protein PKL13_03755 [bacterium]|nr:hypothetical protein [bacterium]
MENKFEQINDYEIVKADDTFKEYQEIENCIVIKNIERIDLEQITSLAGANKAVVAVPENTLYALEINGEKRLFEHSELEARFLDQANKYDTAA